MTSDPKACPHCGEDHNGVTGCRPNDPLPDQKPAVDHYGAERPREWWIDGDLIGVLQMPIPGAVHVVEASRLIDARLTLIDQEVSRQSALKLLDAARRERDAWRSAALRLREALDKVLPAGTWFHLGPYGASPEKDDYDKACLALKEFDAFVSKEKKK